MFAGFLPRDLGDQRFELGPPNGNIQAAVCGALQQEDHVAIGIARVMEDNILSLEGKIERSIAEDERLAGDGYSFCADRVIGRLQIERGSGRRFTKLRAIKIEPNFLELGKGTVTNGDDRPAGQEEPLQAFFESGGEIVGVGWKIFSMEREH